VAVDAFDSTRSPSRHRPQGLIDVSHPRTALVTGASQGIGYETARRLAHQGTRVILHAPSPAEAHSAAARLLGDGVAPGLLRAASADFRRLGDVISLARHIGRHYDRLDLLINNAGALEPPSRTRDGLDANFQINYIAPYALTRLLAPALNTAAARVVILASPRHRDARLHLDDLGGDHGRPADAYAHAQLGLLLFTRALADTAEQRITAVAVHPGCIDTGTFAAVHGRGGLPVADGAAHVLRAADPGVQVVNGGYYEGLRLAEPAFGAGDGSEPIRLWRATARLLGWDYTEARETTGVPQASRSTRVA
jgi:NAD(P)-dependent dehydrogenase (short-subunit alcohol dehydrogenase family)